MTSNSLLNPHQSGFTKRHSTETLLTSLYNKLVSAISHQQVSCLCLLDISAAFDTIDHNILLKRMSTWFSFADTALLWIQSYLSSRSFSVKTPKALPQSCPLTCGVPQGSVLGPLLFILYTTPLSSLIKASSIDHHLYADDTQLFISFSPNRFSDSINHLLIQLFSHFGHFYSAPSSPLLLRGAPDYRTDTVSEFHAEAHRQLQVKDLPKVPTWRLERESNPRPSGRKSSSQPRRHHVPQLIVYSVALAYMYMYIVYLKFTNSRFVYNIYVGLVCICNFLVVFVCSYIYCEVVSITVETAASLMYAANKYMLPKLVRECGKCLSDGLTVNNVIHVLEQSSLFNEDGLKS